MSGSAAIASAQRRRAGGTQGPQQNNKFSRYRSNEPETQIEISTPQKMHIRDVLTVFGARIDSLKGTADAHSAHWDEHDQFLKEVCDRIDSLEETLNKLESSSKQ